MNTVIQGMGNVLRNPVRLLLVVSLLGASLMLVAAMVSLSGSARQELADVHQRVGTAITITSADNDSPKAGQERIVIPNSVVDTVKQAPGVAGVEGHLSRTDADGLLKTAPFQGPDGKAFSVMPLVNGISSGATHFTLEGGATPTLTSGRNFQASDEHSFVALMSQELARINNLTVGSTFTLKGKTFTIIGLYTSSQIFANNSLIVPLATMQSVLGIDGVDSITTYAQSYEQVEPLASRLRGILGKAYNLVTETSNYTTTINSLIAVQNSITLALVIALLTASLVIIFTVFLTVRERTTEIGILKAIGASHWQVIRQLWGEVLALSVLATLVAVTLLAVLGPVVSRAFSVSSSANTPPGNTVGGVTFSSPAMTNLNVHLSGAQLDAGTLLIIVGLCMGLAVLTSVIPAWSVARMKPAEVLRRA